MSFRLFFGWFPPVCPPQGCTLGGFIMSSGVSSSVCPPGCLQVCPEECPLEFLQLPDRIPLVPRGVLQSVSFELLYGVSGEFSEMSSGCPLQRPPWCPPRFPTGCPSSVFRDVLRGVLRMASGVTNSGASEESSGMSSGVHISEVSHLWFLPRWLTKKFCFATVF